jgi:hypothetical protein
MARSCRVGGRGRRTGPRAAGGGPRHRSVREHGVTAEWFRGPHKQLPAVAFTTDMIHLADHGAVEYAANLAPVLARVLAGAATDGGPGRSDARAGGKEQ